MYFHSRDLSIFRTAFFMFWLTGAATVVGQIPRRVRTPREKIVCWVIGWPMFATLLILMAYSVYSMWVLDAPEWLLIIAFFWVLTYLTWKVFIDPNTGPGDLPGGGGRRPRPKAPAPRPADRGPRPICDDGSLFYPWRRR